MISFLRRRKELVLVLGGGALAVGLAIAVAAQQADDGVETAAEGATSVTDGSGDRTSTTDPGSADDATTTSTTVPYDGWVDPASSGRPWGSTVAGILTFRGNPTRSFYGTGPMPIQPQVLWSYPGESGGMCSQSSSEGETRTWCGTGWTGQPAVFERDGRTWVVFGAYDGAVHFVDAATGEDILPPFPTGDIIKGSVTVDPDGFPIVYSGSRDNKIRALAIDRPQAVELWSMDADAVSPTMWNNDWDGSPLVIDDYLFEGGENSQFHIVKLGRAYGADGLVTVAPQLVFNAPGWDDELLSAIGDEEVSIENSVAISGNTVYFANSGGLVQGWDLTGLDAGVAPTRVFRFWTGDDTDASIAIDAEGFLYVASEYERGTDRSEEVGQLMKLDPRNPDAPLVWSFADHDALPAGMWATPAIGDGVVYAATHSGLLLGLDQVTGQVLWQKDLPGPTWQSPVVVDDVLVEGDCSGFLHGYDVSDPRVDPPELWSVDLGGCIESTPAVWAGRIYLGTRSGRFFAIGDVAPEPGTGADGASD